MQFTAALITALTVLGVSAAPTYGNDGNGPSDSATCPVHTDQYCCNTKDGQDPGLLSILDITAGLTCVLSSVLGSTCTTQTNCCVNNGDGNLTCSNTDGTQIPISIPITISL